MRQDLVGAWRSITRSPWRSVLSLCIFSLSLTVAGAAFAIVDGVLLKPLPFRDPDQLHIIGPPSRFQAGRPGSLTRLEVEQLTEAPGIESAAGFIAELFDRRHAEAEGLIGAKVTPSFFETLGIHVALGRSLNAADEGALPVPVLIGHGLYQRRFGSDPTILNRQVRLGNLDVVVVGVMEPHVDYPSHANVWALLDAGATPSRFVFRFLTGVVRLSGPGRPEIAIRRENAVMVPLADEIRPPQAEAMNLIFGATLLLVIVACTHLVAVQLTRLADNSRQTAIRLTLGATGGQVARQWILETALLHAAGLVLAFPLARAVLAAMIRALPADIAIRPAIAVDVRTLVFQAAATCLVVAASGAIVFARFRRSAVSLSSLGNLEGDIRGARTRNALMVGQAVILTAILYVAVVSARSYDQTRRVDLGFVPAALHSVSLPEPAGRASAPLIQNLIAELRAHPQIVHATWGISPFNRGRLAVPVDVNEPMTIAALRALELNADERRVAHDYFDVAGISILAGRSFADNNESRASVIISQTLAKTIGATLNDVVYISSNRPSRVIGIAGDVRIEGPERPPRAIVYRLAARPDGDLLIRARPGVDPQAIVKAQVKRIFGTSEPVLITAGQQVYTRLMAPQRSRAVLLGLLATLTLLLGAASLGHLVGHAVSRSRRETAVRLALGGRAGRLALDMLRRTLTNVGLGALLGLTGGVLAAGVMSSLLFGVEAIDALSILLSLGGVIAAAAIAAVPQLLSLFHVDPVRLLRTE